MSGVELAHLVTSVAVWDATTLGIALSLRANQSVRPGKIPPSSSQVVRPNSITPVSRMGPIANLSPST
ncbi:hypothetical protein ACFQ1S_16720, partial [Kibdelosporangium lantanae]